MDFYKQEEKGIDMSHLVLDKMNDALLTNSGCESQFAEFDNSVKKFVGLQQLGLCLTWEKIEVIRNSEDWTIMN